MKNKGFTLIELIIVIVLLGILSATALPRYVDFSTTAKKNALKSLEGALRSATELSHLACNIEATCNVNVLDQYRNIPSIGQTIRFQYGYPDAGNCFGSSGNEIDAMVDTSKFTCEKEWPWSTRWNIPNTTNCYVKYTQAAAAGQKPVIVIVDSGC